MLWCLLGENEEAYSDLDASDSSSIGERIGFVIAICVIRERSDEWKTVIILVLTGSSIINHRLGQEIVVSGTFVKLKKELSAALGRSNFLPVLDWQRCNYRDRSSSEGKVKSSIARSGDCPRIELSKSKVSCQSNHCPIVRISSLSSICTGKESILEIESLLILNRRLQRPSYVLNSAISQKNLLS